MIVLLPGGPPDGGSAWLVCISFSDTQSHQSPGPLAAEATLLQEPRALPPSKPRSGHHPALILVATAAFLRH